MTSPFTLFITGRLRKQHSDHWRLYDEKVWMWQSLPMLSGYRTQCDRCPGLIGQFDATAFCPPLSSISTALIRPMCCHDDVVTCTWQRQRPQEGWLHASRKVQVDSLHQPCIPQGSQSRHETCRTGDVGTLFAAPVGAPARIVKAR